MLQAECERSSRGKYFEKFELMIMIKKLQVPVIRYENLGDINLNLIIARFTHLQSLSKNFLTHAKIKKKMV